MKILLVEDEVHLSDALSQILRNNGYTVECVHDGKEGLHAAMSGLFDVILLDIMLPKLSGLEILKKMRKSDTTTPVILLTARNDVSDRVMGLDYGADDYLPKPFNTDELLARIRAVSRRIDNAAAHTDSLCFSDITLKTDAAMLCNTNGNDEIGLTKKECDLLAFFLRNETTVLPEAVILDSVWDGEGDATPEGLSAYVGFLNKKFEYIKSDTSIRFIRGVGYKLLSSHSSVVDWS